MTPELTSITSRRSHPSLFLRFQPPFPRPIQLGVPRPVPLQSAVLLSRLQCVLPGPGTFSSRLYSSIASPLPHSALALTSNRLASSLDRIWSVSRVSPPLLLPTVTKLACCPQPPPCLVLATLPTCHLVLLLNRTRAAGTGLLGSRCTLVKVGPLLKIGN